MKKIFCIIDALVISLKVLIHETICKQKSDTIDRHFRNELYPEESWRWSFLTKEQFEKLSDDNKFAYQHGLPLLGEENELFNWKKNI